MLSVLMGSTTHVTVVLRRRQSSLTCRCSGLGPPSRLCRGHQSTLLSNHRTHKRLQRIACRSNAILISDPLPNQLCPLRVAGVVKQGHQLAGSPDDVVAMGGNGAGDTHILFFIENLRFSKDGVRALAGSTN